jgi:anaerobic magnesium-protoporphyrin IX monomethyl ester cyclase
LAFKSKGKVIINKPRAPIENLNEIPFPARHLLPLQKYKVNTTGLSQNLPITTVITSRGCPNYCIFCDSHTIFGRRFRFRSAENIIAEIEDVIGKYGITQFDFVDDTFTMDKTRVMQFCNMIESKGIKIKWICNARVNTVDFDILKRIKACGCVRVDFGVESGDQQVINNVRKGITLEQVRNAMKMSKAVGLKTMGFFMVGNPLDSKETINKTLKFIKEVDIDYPTFSLSTPYPGTELFQMAKQKGFIRHENWEEYTTTRRDVKNLPVMRTDKLDYKDMIDLYVYAIKNLARIRFRKGPFKFILTELKKIQSPGDLVKTFRKGLKLVFS